MRSRRARPDGCRRSGARSLGEIDDRHAAAADLSVNDIAVGEGGLEAV